MASSYEPVNHLDEGTHTQIQQIIDAHEGTLDVPHVVTLDDADEYAGTFTNTGTGTKALHVVGNMLVDGSIENEGGPVYNVVSYGADESGATFSDSAIAAAIADIPSYGGKLYFPAGVYKVNGAITFDKPGTIVGDGLIASIIDSYSATADVITLIPATGYTAKVEGLAIRKQVTATDGAGIRLTSSGDGINMPTIEHCAIQHQYYGVRADKAVGITINGCYIAENLNSGLYLQNTTNVDSGDHAISNCIFANVAAISGSDVAIRQLSSGGLKISNNKFIGFTDQYHLSLAAGASTGVLVIDGNSFEGQGTSTHSNIRFDNSSGGSLWVYSIISNNEFGCLGPEASLIIGTAGGWLDTMIVSGNTFQVAGTKCISLAGGSHIYIHGNNIFGQGGSSVAFEVGAGVSHLHIGRNHIRGITTLLSGATPEIMEPCVQYGTTTSVTNTVYGALYSTPDITVTFPVAYRTAPKVTASCEGNGGAYNGAVGVAIKSVSVSQFVCSLVGITNGVTLTLHWSAYGDESI